MVFLFKTEIVPLRISNARLVSYLRTRYESIGSGAHAVILGITAKLFPGFNDDPMVPEIGTVIEAISTKFENDSAAIMAKARCRFRRLSQVMDVTFTIPMARVVILSDEIITYSPSAAKYHCDSFYAAANPWPVWMNRMYHAKSLMKDAKELQSKIVSVNNPQHGCYYF